MDTTLIVGIILFTGFAMGELVQKLMLPRVTGYIIAGVLLNPQLFGIIPANVGRHTDFVRSTPLVKRYTALGLIPSGGIIIGLALLLKQTPAFSSFADTVINVIIGATVIHELAGPILVQLAFRKSGEMGTTERLS